nr:fatty acid synthase-like [Parasteatoda tepidariorum]
MFAKKLQKHFEDLPIIIENLKLTRATVMNKKHTLKLGFDFHKDNSFEILEGSSVVASGEIRKWESTTFSEPEPFYDCDEASTVDGTDLYNDLRLKGYEYGPEFQAIAKMSLDGSKYILQWKEGRWIPFLDACLATFLLSDSENDFVLPTGALAIKIDPNALKRKLETDLKHKEVPVNINRNTKICRSVGIEIENIYFEIASRRIKSTQPTVEAHTFIPYEFQHTIEEDCKVDLYQYMQTCNELLDIVGQKSENNVENIKFQLKKQEDIDGNVFEKFPRNLSFLKCLKELSKAETLAEKTPVELRCYLKEFGNDLLNTTMIKGYGLKIMLDIIEENTFQKLNICEISSNFTSILPEIDILAKKNSYLKFKSYTLIYEHKNSVDKDIFSKSGINLCPSSLISKLTSEKKEDVAVSSFYCGSSSELKQQIETLCSILSKNGFIIFYHKEKLTDLEKFLSKQCHENIPIQSRSTLENILHENKLEVVSCARDIFGSALYLLRPAVSGGNHVVVKITESHDFRWVEELKRRMKQSDKEYLWLVSEDDSSSGILGLVNCLKLEPGGERIRFMSRSGILWSRCERPSNMWTIKRPWNGNNHHCKPSTCCRCTGRVESRASRYCTRSLCYCFICPNNARRPH